VTQKTPEYELPNADEFFAGAEDCDVISKVVEELRVEEEKHPEQSAMREQEAWSEVANKVVGAEDAGNYSSDD